MLSVKSNHHVLRSSHGSGLVMAIAGLAVIVLILVLGISFVTQVAIAGYYRDKIAFIARQGATYTANEMYWCDAPRLHNSATAGVPVALDEAAAAAKPIINELLKRSGLGGTSNQIDITGDEEQVTVTITVAGLAVPVKSSLWPSSINLKISEQKFFSEDKPPGVMLMQLSGKSNTCVAIPARGFTSELTGLNRAYNLPFPPDLKKQKGDPTSPRPGKQNGFCTWF